MQPWTAPRPAPVPPAPMATGDTTPTYYVLIPRRLAEDLRTAPIAIAAFALIARIFRATGQPVPLSAGDLQVFDPSLRDGAAARALIHLAKTPWVSVTPRLGGKSTYTPTWGIIGDTPCPWDLHAPCLGRPRHIPTLRLDQNILDVCMGRLDPHPAPPAIARRYLTTPLLGLREVGAYTLALAGLPVANPILDDLHLLVHGQPRPLPDEATILASASQRAPDALTDAGWRRTAFPPPPPPPAEPGHVLFFVPPRQIGPMTGGRLGEGLGEGLGNQIGHGAHGAGAITAAESLKTSVVIDTSRSHGVMEEKEKDSTTSPQANNAHHGGGGDIPLRHRTAGRRVPPPTDSPVPSESAQLLLAVGVRRSVAQRLADRPVAQVTRVIAQSRARTDVRDLPAWVVSALRDLPATDVPMEPEQLLSALPIYQHSGLTDEQRDRWIYRFRAVHTAAEQRAILARLAQEHPADHLGDLPLPDAIPVPVVHERPLSALPIYQHPGLTDEQRNRWIYRFRAVATPAEQRAILARLEQEHPA
ncbi:hypothetical protein K2Z83_19790 [Oscillochloris sp. ZM17-4]|uniref:hypothetical protein n=1 Tax=Oscillochloris sp. ZM17-4 TaxID=2866714 RepID=UPI001C731491|nr:hypothetical protein [Oscillochloris sp. ZM17-4]MBX0329911.1 hypothetical protein [Oscillochloris sp. ZM17-4]